MFFAIIVKLYFSKALHLRFLTVFWIRLFLNKHLTLCIVWYIFRTLPIIAYSDIFRLIHGLFRHIQTYCDIFRTLCNSCIFRTLPCSEFWHIWDQDNIQNSAKAYFGIFRTLRNPRIFRTLSYSEICRIQNFGIVRTGSIFRILLYMDTQAYSRMIVTITLSFFFSL